MTTIAALLRDHRTSRALTQEELAATAHLTAKAIGAIERGERRRPYPQTVRALADALELDAGQRAEIFAAARGDQDDTGDRSGRRTAPAVEGLADAVRITGPVVGRTADVAAVRSLLRSSPRRIVTLTGPGGVGKSTLARLVADESRSVFPDGVVMVPLADVVDAHQVVGAAAVAVGVAALGLDAGVEELAEVLAGRSMLLVLDNLEHLLGCGPDLAELVTRCADLRLLVTSRRPLRIRAEQRLPVAPLSDDDALSLLRERLSAAGGAVSDDVAQALCRRADGLPLAVELAASAASYLGSEALDREIERTAVGAPRDLPARQRSMARTFDWSWALLDDPARNLLARLSVCACFPLALAEAVDEDADDTADALIELLEHSLVVPSSEVAGVRRFRLLEPIRQHAAVRLEPADRDEARARLAQYTLANARRLVQPLRGSGQAAALQTLDAEFANVRRSMEWFLDHSTEDAAELLCRIWLHLALRRHIEEGREWAERLRPRPMTDLARARLLLASAGISLFTAPDQAVAWACESLRLSSTLQNERLVEEAASLAASAAVIGGSFVEAHDLVVQAQQLHRTADRWVDVPILISAGHEALLLGRADEADAVLARAEVMARSLGAPFEIGSVLTARGAVLDRLSRFAEASSCLVEALELCIVISNSWTTAYTLSGLASVAVRVGEHQAAARFFGAAARAAVTHFVRDCFPTTSATVEADVTTARAVLGDEVFEAEGRVGRLSRLPDLLTLARTVRLRAQSPGSIEGPVDGASETAYAAS